MEFFPILALKIFSDKSYISEGIQHDFMLCHFWGISLETPLEGPEYPWTRRFVCYEEIGRSFLEMVPLEEADLAIMPINWLNIRGNTWRTIGRNKVAKELAIKFAEKAEKAGKKVVVFFAGDGSDEKIPIKNAIVFRESLYRSRKKLSDFAIFCL